MVLQCNAGEHVDNFIQDTETSKKMEFEVSSESFFFILVILEFMLLLLFIYIKHTILQFYPTSVLLLRPPIPGPALIELSLLLRLLLLSAFFNKYLLLKNFLKR